MEPLFFKAENSKAANRRSSKNSRFNGAAFFQSGKWYHKAKYSTWQSASMEPLFFKAENAWCASRVIGGTRRFNGAAFFQSGKSGHKVGV